MEWLQHAKFVRVREEVITTIQRNEYRFRRTPNVLFLCGGRGSVVRDRLREYIRKRRDDTIVFYAENVWTALSEVQGLSALQMEAQLASLSDIVVIIVESIGTSAELGAFSLSDELRKKLLPILDPKHRTGESFIETGPVRWIDSDSNFRPAIWVDHKSVLEAAAELEDRLNKILPAPVRVADLVASPKHLLFFLCDLVAVFGPCLSSHIAFYTERIVGSDPGSIPMLLGLGRAMGILSAFRSRDGADLFYTPLVDGQLPVFHYTKKHFGIPSLRAKVLSVMQKVPAARVALREFELTVCC